jgi:DNA-binding transcriptional MerR regulator
METNRKQYTVHQLAQLAGVSVRTLHHYDQIGLLKPSSRTGAGYRLYQQVDLLHLQQILFYKELGFPLIEIQRILSDPEFDQFQALQKHRRMLLKEMDRLNCLLNTLEKTIAAYKEDTMPLTDEELYEGFSKEQVERYEREVNEKYDPELVKESNRRVRNMSKERWQAVKKEGEDITRLIASLANRPPADPQVQAAIARHHAHIENFYPVSPEIYRGLAQMYVEHPEFRAYYEKYGPNLADFMQAAMLYFCEHTLAKS